MKWMRCLPALAWTAFAAQNDATLAIYTQFAQPPGRYVLQHMQAEMAQIVDPLQMHVDWRSLNDTGAAEPATEILIVRFRGACESNVLPPPALQGPLGWTHISNGQILPFTDVDCDRILGLMASPMATALPGDRAHLLGRAMARVLAHELYHLLGDTTQHGSSGISKPVFNAWDLSCPHLSFTTQGLSRVRQHAFRLTP